MNNTHTPNTMDNFTLTTEQLSDIIDQAFRLGKIYASDELNSCRDIKRVPVFEEDNQWNAYIEDNNGITLHSGDAKADILFEALKDQIRIRFHQTVDFD